MPDTKKWQVNLNFGIEADSEQAAKSEADRLGGAIAEKFNLDEMDHSVTKMTETEYAGQTGGTTKVSGSEKTSS